MNRYGKFDFNNNDSKLFSRYSSFFDEFIINEFGRKQKADTSHKGHKALMAKIKAHVENNLIRLEKIR